MIETDAAMAETTAFISRDHKLFIGAERSAARSGRTIDVYNPATGKVITQVPSGNKEDIDLAVAAARQAFDDSDWSRMKPGDRERLLWRLADLIEQNSELLGEIESIDNGKSKAIAQGVDIRLAVDFLRYHLRRS